MRAVVTMAGAAGATAAQTAAAKVAAAKVRAAAGRAAQTAAARAMVVAMGAAREACHTNRVGHEPSGRVSSGSFNGDAG